MSFKQFRKNLKSRWDQYVAVSKRTEIISSRKHKIKDMIKIINLENDPIEGVLICELLLLRVKEEVEMKMVSIEKQQIQLEKLYRKI